MRLRRDGDGQLATSEDWTVQETKLSILTRVKRQ
jgi:hypothetical protein